MALEKQSGSSATSYVVEGASMSCPRGSMKQKLQVPMPHKMSLGGKNVANIGDSKPMVNIQPFGACKVPPPVNQIPCTCVVTAPWVPGKATVMVGGMPVLTKDSMAICAMGGIIKFEDDGQ